MGVLAQSKKKSQVNADSTNTTRLSMDYGLGRRLVNQILNRPCMLSYILAIQSSDTYLLHTIVELIEGQHKSAQFKTRVQHTYAQLAMTNETYNHITLCRLHSIVI